MKLFSLLAAIAMAGACRSGFAQNASTQTLTNAAPQTLTLQQAQDIAIHNHPQITEAELLALASKQAVRSTRSAYLPHLEADATAAGAAAPNTRIAAGGLNNPVILDRQADGVSISQLITDFGRTRNLIASSKLEANAQEQNAVATRAQILLAVNSSYFATLEAQSVLAVAKQTVATRQLTYDRISELATNKLKSGLDVSFARVDLEQSKLLLANSRNDLQSQLASLENLLGEREPHNYQLSDVPLVTNQPPDSPQLIQMAFQDRPDLAQLRFSLDAAQRFARAEKDLNYPTINAVGAAGVIPIHDPLLRQNYAAAGVNLRLPIFEGMLFDARQKEADLRAKAAAENVRDLEDNIIRDVRIAALNLSYAIEQIQLTGELLASANEEFTLAQARRQVGTTSIVELSEAQLRLTQAQIAEARAKYEFQIRNSILNFQTGQLK